MRSIEEELGFQVNKIGRFVVFVNSIYIVGCRGASQLGGSLLGIPPRV